MICGVRGCAGSGLDGSFRNSLREGEKELGLGWGQGHGKGLVRRRLFELSYFRPFLNPCLHLIDITSLSPSRS